MKQLLFAAALILSMALNSEAKTSAKNKELWNGLKAAIKSGQTTSIANTENYRKVSFFFSDKIASAFFDVESDQLIGFSIPMAIADLSQETVEKIKTRFSNYSFKEAIMFVKQNGIAEFYVSMSRAGKPTIVLSINAGGRVRYFGKE